MGLGAGPPPAPEHGGQPSDASSTGSASTGAAAGADPGRQGQSSDAIRSLRGVGPSTVAALAELGVAVVGDLASMPDDQVAAIKAGKSNLKIDSLRRNALAWTQLKTEGH